MTVGVMRKSRALRPLALVAAAAAAVSCAEGRGGPIPYDVSLSVPDAPRLVPLEAGYRIAPLDVVSVRVFRMAALSGDYEVDLAGNVSLPLVGSVPAAELTTEELDARLTARFGERYLENPDVSVGIKSSTRRSVTVDGAVKTSGSYPVNGPTSLIQAIALSGGVSDDANPRRVAVFRTVGGKRQAAAFDLTAIRRGQAPDPAIYPGDIVVVDGSSIKALQKQILSNVPLLSIFRPY